MSQGAGRRVQGAGSKVEPVAQAARPVWQANSMRDVTRIQGAVVTCRERKNMGRVEDEHLDVLQNFVR
jgi:hypothetical protein